MLPRSAVIAFVAVVLAVPAAHALPVNLESRVDSVTVYPSGVTIRRIGRTRVAAGEQQVQFGPLPLSLAEETIRIGGFGPGVTAESVTVRATTMGELGANARIARLEAVERRTPEQNRALAAARDEAQRAVKVVAVDLSANEAGDLALSIEYMVPNAAAWRPSYAARLDAEGARVGLDLFATIRQETGEDWREVRLAVSSVVPAAGLALPRLGEQAIQLEAPVRIADAEMLLAMPGAAARAAPGAPAAVPQMQMPVRPAVRPPRQVPIEQAQGVATPNLLAARLDIPGRVTIVSGASPRRVLAAHADLESTLEYQAAPRQSSSVFLAARFRNANPFPLLAGPAALFVGTDYVGTTNVAQTGIEEDVLLPFGIDAGITIDRTLASRAVTLRGGRVDTALRWQLRLTNHRERAIEVTVFDQLPVSRTAGLTVAVAPGSRAADPRDDADAPGVLRWRIRADAGETERWTFGYSVSAPRDRGLIGTID